MAVTLADLALVCFDPAKHDVQGFDCGDADLKDFLKSDAARYQSEHLSHTRLALLSGEIAGYITLLADCIILKTREKKQALEQLRDAHQTVFTFPAVKIGRLAIDRKHKGQRIGAQLLKYTVGLVARLNNDLSVGCRFVTVDAYPESVSWYQKNGFVFNKHYEAPEKNHPSMRYDILKSPEIT